MDSEFGLHPEAIPGAPELLRWVTTLRLPAVGRLREAPDGLGELLASGVLSEVLVENNALWTRLPGADWATHGVRVRDAITTAARDLTSWQVEAADDELLALVAGDVIDRTLGAYIASHGGQITLLSAADGQVRVALEGACAGCPAAGLTLHGRIQKSIRARLGEHIEVQDASPRRGRPRLLSVTRPVRPG
ncbi:MAG: NifU family protein [Brooklawnia sp.]